MTKRKIDALIQKGTRSNHVRHRVSPKAMKAIERNMKELVAAEATGCVLPSRPAIVEWVAEQHGVRVTPNTVGYWLNKIRNGGSIT